MEVGTDNSGELRSPACLTSNVRQKMKDEPIIVLFNTVTAAVGGRKIFAVLWTSWLLVGILAHYLQDFAGVDPVRPRSLYAFSLMVVGAISLAVYLMRSLLSERGRCELFARRPDLPPVGAVMKIAVWVIPVLAFGAAVAPIALR